MTGWYLSSSTSMVAPMVAGHATSTGQVFDTSRIYGNSLLFRDINEETNGGSSLIGFDLYAGREGGLGRNHLDYLHFLIFKADKSKVLKTESSSTSTPKSS